MRFKAFNGLGDPHPIVAEATVVLVEAEDGTPLAVMQQHMRSDSGRIAVSVTTPKDANFHQMLRQLGIDKLVIVDRIDERLAGLSRNLPVVNGDFAA